MTTLQHSVFFASHLSRRLNKEFSYDSSVDEISLTELPGYDNPVAVATQLVDDFCSLPWHYAFSIDLNGSLANKLRRALPYDEPGQVFPLDHSISLARPDDRYAAMYPLLSEEKERGSTPLASILLRGTLPFEWKYDEIYVTIHNTGYVPRWGTSTPVDDAISNFKSFIGLGLAVRLFEPRRELGLAHALGHFNRKKIAVHRHKNLKWVYDREIELSYDVTELLDRLDILNIIDEKSLTVFIRERLGLVKLAFGHPERTHKIRLSSEWLFDSYRTKSDLLAFVQAAVAVEILLGDKAHSDIMGLEKLLANRCAYLIGKSYSQRDEVLKDFERIYSVRSKIVHQGKTKLNREERALFWNLRWICGRAIQEELELLRARPGRLAGG